MKKLLGILVLGLIFFSTSADAFTKTKKTKFKKGATISGQIVWDKRLKIDLDPGEWEVVDHWPWTVNAIHGKYVALAQMKGNIVDKFVEIETVSVNGKWIGYLHDWFQEVFFKNKYDGCYDRPEYYLVERYKQGAAFNCFLIMHDDTQRNLFASDDPFAQPYTSIIRKWLREKNYINPPIMLAAAHWFYSPPVGRLYTYEVWINPETHGAPKNKFTTEETSEYHRSNINNYPKKKKFMESFIGQQAYIHKKFEEMTDAKSYHKLDLDRYINEKDIKKTIKAKTEISSSDTTEKLKDCVKLFKANDLTKKQFENCKNKVLSQ